MANTSANNHRTLSVSSILKRILMVIVGATILATSATITLAAYLVNRVSKPRRTHRPPHFTFTPWEFQVPYREIEIPIDGHEISGWFLPQKRPDAPCILALSGFASNKAELLGIASNLYRDGFSLLLIDFRGAGRSRGDVVTMGHNETDDARAAVDWIEQNVPGARIGVIGYSMGGSVALTLAATDRRINAVVSDSAFAAQRSLYIHHIRRKTGLWPAPILAAAGPLLRRRHRRSLDDFVPADIAHLIAPRPLMLIHSRDDTVVPIADGMEIWNNAGEPKVAWILDDVGHCGAYFNDRETYCKRVSEFLGDALSPSE